MGCIPLITSLLDPRIILVVLFWCISAGALYVLGLHCTNRRYLCALMLPVRSNFKVFCRFNVLAMALLVIPFLPASNLLIRVGFVLAERVLYIPSMGYCMLVGLAYEMVEQRLHLFRQSSRNLERLGVVILLILGAKSILVNTKISIPTVKNRVLPPRV